MWTTAATNAEQRSCEPCQWGARADAYAEPQTGRFNKGWRTTMSSTTDKPTFYERLGGVYSIAAVVDAFIDRVMNNPILNANPAVDEAHHRAHGRSSIPNAALDARHDADHRSRLCPARPGKCAPGGPSQSSAAKQSP